MKPVSARGPDQVHFDEAMIVRAGAEITDLAVGDVFGYGFRVAR